MGHKRFIYLLAALLAILTTSLFIITRGTSSTMFDRSYIYRVYRDGVYLGTLDNVVSEFEYDQEINTSAARITIEVADTTDNAGEDAPELLTEAGETIDTEDGEPLLLERVPDVIGTKDSGTLIANYNDVVVSEITPDNPNGTTVFSGYMAKIRPTFRQQATTFIDVFSYGNDIDDYIYGNVTTALQVNQSSKDSDIGFWKGRDYGQSFTTDSDQTDIVTIRLSLYVNSGSKTFYLFLYDSAATANAGGTPLGSTTRTISNTSPADVDFTFSSAVTVTPSTSYFFSLISDASSNSGDPTSWCVFEDYEASNIYAGGSMYRNTGSGFTIVNPTYDMYFKVYSGTLETDADFVSTDPADMVRDAVELYQSQGGAANYTVASITDTGLSVDYSFKLATVREIIQKARELSPNYYWFIDPATTLLTFKPISTTADHQFVLGADVESFDLEMSVEEIKNVVYFTGGPTAGVNLLTQYTDTVSLAINRRGMSRLYDNRIDDSTSATADSLVDSFFDEHDDEIYRGELTILADKYDISTISLGQTVNVTGQNNFVDDLLMQITRLKRRCDSVTLTLGELPLRRERYIESISKEVEKVTTLDNPSAPS